MRNQLFKFTVSRGDRLVVGHVVAPEEQRAIEIVTQTEIEANRENQGVSLERVDKTLPPDRRKGLVPLLKSGVVGPASFSQAIGWVTHSVPAPKLCFYRITKHEGGESFVIAPTMDIAVAVHCETNQLEEGEGSLFRVQDGFYGLHAECMRGLPSLLEYGPISMIVWDDDAGWKFA